MAKTNSWFTHMFGDDRPPVMQGVGYHLADFVIGVLDRMKERRKEEEERYESHLNTRLNMIDQVRSDYEWEMDHLRKQASLLRHEMDYILQTNDDEQLDTVLEKIRDEAEFKEEDEDDDA